MVQSPIENLSRENLSRKSHVESHVQENERAIARQVSPTLFVGLAVGSMLISAALALFGRQKETANFVGLWTPSLLLIGIYNKLTKLEEAEETHSMQRVA